MINLSNRGSKSHWKILKFLSQKSQEFIQNKNKEQTSFSYLKTLNDKLSQLEINF